jgi:hypothetical protein
MNIPYNRFGAAILGLGLFALLRGYASGENEANTSVPAEVFLSGAWNTSAAHPRVALSAGLPTTVAEASIRVWSSYYDDNADIAHWVSTDRGESKTTVQESSGAVVEGRNIDLRQVSTGSGTGSVREGLWQALLQPVGAEGFTKFDYAVLPGKTTQVLDLAKPRQFVLTFSGHTNPPCNNGQLRILVDGQPLKYRTGQEVVLTAPNSIWSFGKSVHVILAGTCTLPNPAPTGATALYKGSVKVAH